MFVKAAHVKNALVPILVTELGILILIKPDERNTDCSIVDNVLPASKVTVVKDAHKLKQLFPIVVTELGIITLVKVPD
jgi:hypothetical protein